MGPLEGTPVTHAIGQTRISTSGSTGRTTVWLRGDHDLSTSAELSAMISGVVASGLGDVVVDLSAVSFMDAGTIGHIVGASNRLAAQSRDLVVREPSTPARRVLQICGLEGLSGAAPDRDGASSGL